MGGVDLCVRCVKGVEVVNGLTLKAGWENHDLVLIVRIKMSDEVCHVYCQLQCKSFLRGVWTGAADIPQAILLLMYSHRNRAVVKLSGSIRNNSVTRAS